MPIQLHLISIRLWTHLWFLSSKCESFLLLFLSVFPSFCLSFFLPFLLTYFLSVVPSFRFSFLLTFSLSLLSVCLSFLLSYFLSVYLSIFLSFFLSFFLSLSPHLHSGPFFLTCNSSCHIPSYSDISETILSFLDTSQIRLPSSSHYRILQLPLCSIL